MSREITLAVQDMDTFPSLECKLITHAYAHEGSFLILQGTNDKAIGWVDMHAALKGKVYRHHWIEPETTTPAEAGVVHSSALTDIAAERRRQIEVEGWHAAHDDLHDGGDLARAAACYAFGSTISPYALAHGWRMDEWPWDLKWWKPGPARRMLVKAGALIVAEIERLDRASSPQTKEG